MTERTADAQQMEAARSLATKLQAFHESLTRDEQQVFDAALRSVATSANETTEDVAGHWSIGLMPLVVVRAAEMAVQQQEGTMTNAQFVEQVTGRPFGR